MSNIKLKERKNIQELKQRFFNFLQRFTLFDIRRERSKRNTDIEETCDTLLYDLEILSQRKELIAMQVEEGEKELKHIRLLVKEEKQKLIEYKELNNAFGQRDETYKVLVQDLEAYIKPKAKH